MALDPRVASSPGGVAGVRIRCRSGGSDTNYKRQGEIPVHAEPTHFTIRCAYKWLNRRGGKRSSFNWGQFKVALEKSGIAWPRVVENKRTHAVFVS